MFPLCIVHGNHGCTYGEHPDGRGPRRRLVLVACLILTAVGGLTLAGCEPTGSSGAAATRVAHPPDAATVPLGGRDRDVDLDAFHFE